MRQIVIKLVLHKQAGTQHKHVINTVLNVYPFHAITDYAGFVAWSTLATTIL